ncbi:glycosyltransferase family 4 protein [Methylobacterium sp. CM6244]
MPAIFNGLLVAVIAPQSSAYLSSLIATIDAPSGQILVFGGSAGDDMTRLCRTLNIEFFPVDEDLSFNQLWTQTHRVARSRSAAFLLLIDGSAESVPPLVSVLLSEMQADPGLAIVSPALTLTDQNGSRIEAQRSGWDLRHNRLGPDPKVLDPTPNRLEADYCLLSCALLRMSAIDDLDASALQQDLVGFSAGLGLRLRDAGYACASLPKVSITLTKPVVTSSLTTGLDGIRSLSTHGVRLNSPHLNDTSSWGRVKRNLREELDRCGILDMRAPRLSFAHPGLRPFDYLYSVWETDRLPSNWVGFEGRYRAVFVASAWNAEVFRSGGFSNVRHVPLGVDTDLFHPWGTPHRAYDETTFLWFAHNQHRKGLDVCLEAWRLFRLERPLTRLIVMGTALKGAFCGSAAAPIRRGPFAIEERSQDGISVWEIVGSLSDGDIAAIYRGVDVVLSTARSEGFGFVTAESLACGTTSIFANYGASREFVYPSALFFEGRKAPADYSDMGFADVGHWWEPNVGDLVARMREAYDLGDQGRKEVGLAGMRLIRRSFTWRNTALALRKGLTDVETNEGVWRFHRAKPDGGRHRPQTRVTLLEDAGREAWFGAANRVTIATRSFRTTWSANGFAAAARVLARQLATFLKKRYRKL